MARAFNGTTQWLLGASVPVVQPPFTIACWFRATAVVDDEVLVNLSLHTADWSSHSLSASGATAGDPVKATTYLHAAPFTAVSAVTSTGFAADTWYHACGVWASTSSRAAYIGGGSKGTNADPKICANMTRTAIAAVQQSGGALACFGGRIAEAGIWNVALTDAEVAILGAGYCPLFVRPQSLVSYWPFVRDNDKDIVGVTNLTPQNAPTVESHSPVLYPYGYVTPGRVGAAPATLRTLATLGAGR